MSLIDDIQGLLAQHAPELDRQASVAASVDADPAMRAVAAAGSLTAGLRQHLGDFIAALDAEVGQLVADATENGRAAGVASVQPAEGEPPQ